MSSELTSGFIPDIETEENKNNKTSTIISNHSISKEFSTLQIDLLVLLQIVTSIGDFKILPFFKKVIYTQLLETHILKMYTHNEFRL